MYVDCAYAPMLDPVWTFRVRVPGPSVPDSLSISVPFPFPSPCVTSHRALLAYSSLFHCPITLDNPYPILSSFRGSTSHLVDL